MIHYTCDLCKRELDPTVELRYVVRMEVFAATETADENEESDRDHLEEIQDILERLGDGEMDPLEDHAFQQFRYDLCSECRKKFVENPLARESAKHFDFSPN